VRATSGREVVSSDGIFIVVTPICFSSITNSVMCTPLPQDVIAVHAHTLSHVLNLSLSLTRVCVRAIMQILLLQILLLDCVRVASSG